MRATHTYTGVAGNRLTATPAVFTYGGVAAGIAEIGRVLAKRKVGYGDQSQENE
jgi:hypothetical protein